MPKRKSSDPHFNDLIQDIDIEKFRDSVKAGFVDFPDARRSSRSIVYPAWYLMFVILSGYLAGGNTIDDIAHFAELKSDWIRHLTDSDGTPS